MHFTIECTSAVSSDVEGHMYEHAKSLGITLITISLRLVIILLTSSFCMKTPLYSPSLMKYHTRLLTLTGDGSGTWTLSRIGTAEGRMGVDREILILEDKLAEVGGWERRLKELDDLLAVRDHDMAM
jgi:ATP-binding cassette subfamily D (ALD) long-chain fatty acid import protein